MAMDIVVADARSVASAAAALARSVERGEGLDTASERLELQASRVLGDERAGFDSSSESPVSETELAAEALAQLNIGVTLIRAENALQSPDQAPALQEAVTALEADADATEAGDAVAEQHGFDARPGGVLLDVGAAGELALDEIAANAAEVARGVVRKSVGRVLPMLPAEVRCVATNLTAGITSRLLSWGLKAVRRGIDLLLSLVDIGHLERARDRIDALLAGLGEKKDSLALMDAAIGVADVRAALASGQTGRTLDDETTVDELVRLSERFARLSALLGRITVAVAGLGTALAALQVTLPAATAVTVTALALLLGVVVVLGRDYTGATDLPGSVVGVRFLVTGDGHVVP